MLWGQPQKLGIGHRGREAGRRNSGLGVALRGFSAVFRIFDVSPIGLYRSPRHGCDVIGFILPVGRSVGRLPSWRRQAASLCSVAELVFSFSESSSFRSALLREKKCEPNSGVSRLANGGGAVGAELERRRCPRCQRGELWWGVHRVGTGHFLDPTRPDPRPVSEMEIGHLS